MNKQTDPMRRERRLEDYTDERLREMQESCRRKMADNNRREAINETMIDLIHKARWAMDDAGIYAGKTDPYGPIARKLEEIRVPMIQMENELRYGPAQVGYESCTWTSREV